MRIVFAGTPAFAETQLHALLETKHEIVAVYTQPDKPAGRGQKLQMSPVKTLALKHHIPIEQPSSLKSQEVLNTLKNYHADIMIVAAYGLLLPKAILDAPRYGCINVHASLLPRWRGASPIQQAILAGDEKSGISIMQMDIGLDTGDILAEKSCIITSEDTAQTLHDKLALLGAELLVKTLDNIPPTIAPSKQDPEKVKYAGKIIKEDALIDWHSSAIEIDRKIRAFNPWPIAYTAIENQPVRIWHAKVMMQNTSGKPGEIIEHTQEGIVVATGKGAILITNAQLPGKKMMSFSEILKGHHQLFERNNRFDVKQEIHLRPTSSR